MNTVKKVGGIAAITWKGLLIYRADAWLNIVFAGARVILTFLLWSAVFSAKDRIGDYTLPMMITYAVFSTQLAQLQHKDDHAWQLASEVRAGTFSKYLVHPFSITGHFFGLWLGAWTHQLLLSLVTILVWALAFWRYMVIPVNADLVWLLILVPLGGVFMMAFNHAVSLASLKFTEITGLLIFKSNLVEFFSGALIPLQLLPDWFERVLRITPFYYVIYYPVNFLLGAENQPPLRACLVLAGWTLVFVLAARYWLRSAHRFYEGVGI
ncbi:MAG: ABC-2 family transporter protein [Anaerolineae bacterium]|nr:ABC-2 family transporter protein [Anaerolineae bacterium]